MQEKRNDIISLLQSDILRLEGFKTSEEPSVDLGLGEIIRDAFHHGSFPLGAVHEFISGHAAATSGFIAGIFSSLLKVAGTAMWISANRSIFPPALKSFGLQPEHFIFVDLKKERDVQWAMEEALKCSALTAVVGEMNDLSFLASRRLQLAVEQSRTTGFILRQNVIKLSPTACVARWKVSSMASEPVDGLPGIGFPQWRVELVRIRNGRPGVWDIRWVNGRFEPVVRKTSAFTRRIQKAG